MRRAITWSLVLAVLAAPWMPVAGETFTYIRYRGGSIKAKGNPFDWNTTLTVTFDGIQIAVAHSPVVRLKPDQVTNLISGADAQRRVAEVVTLGGTTPPPSLFGLLKGKKEELIGILYKAGDGKPAGILIESPYPMAILYSLKLITKKEIETTP